MGSGDILLGGNVTLRWTIASISSREGVAILLGMLHATETVISSGRLGLWLKCAFTLPFFYYFKVKVHCITSVEGIKITVRLT